MHFKFHIREISLRLKKNIFLHTMYLHSFPLKLTALFLSLPPLFPLFPSSYFPLSVGRLLIEFSSQMTMERVQKENPNVTEGGRYTPPDCRPRWKVRIYPFGIKQVNTDVRKNGQLSRIHNKASKSSHQQKSAALIPPLRLKTEHSSRLYMS